MYSPNQKPFFSSTTYIVLDALFVIFSALYLMGDADHMDNFLKYVKAVPVWILVVQLIPLRDIHRHITTIIVGLLFGSVGDMFLLWGDNFICFALGALSFLVGHIFYVTAMVHIAEDLAQNKVSMENVLKTYPLYIIIWLLLVMFSFFSISTLNSNLSGTDPIRYVLDLYGTILVLLTMGGFFFFFTGRTVSDSSYWAGLLFMFGSLVFFFSDNFLAHGKYNDTYKHRVTASTNAYFIMITYYAAQFMIGKGAYFVAVHFREAQTPLLKQ